MASHFWYSTLLKHQFTVLINKLLRLYLKSVQILSVHVDHRRPIMHYPRSRHHPRPWPHVGHGGRKVKVIGWMQSYPDLDGPRPLVHHLVYMNFKQFLWTEGSTGQHHAVVKVIQSTENQRPGLTPTIYTAVSDQPLHSYMYIECAVITSYWLGSVCCYTEFLTWICMLLQWVTDLDLCAVILSFWLGLVCCYIE